MKKWIVVLLLSPLFINMETSAKVVYTTSKTEVKETKAQQKVEIKRLSARLDEIHKLATSTQLSVMEKKELRQEVQTIKQRLEKMEGVYLYLSLTAILIILLLIILL